MDKALRKRIHHLVRDAETILQSANEFAVPPNEAPGNTTILTEATWNTFLLKKEWKGLVGSQGQAFFTGIKARNIKNAQLKKVWNILWDLTKACIYAQHGGLAQETKIAPSVFAEETLKDKDEIEIEYFFEVDLAEPPASEAWEAETVEDAKNTKSIKPQLVDTAFYCSAYAEAFLRAEASGDNRKEPAIQPVDNLKAFAIKPAQRAASILMNFTLSDGDTDKKAQPWYEEFAEVLTNYDHDKDLALHAVRIAGIWKHLNRLNTPEWDLTLPPCDEDQLNEALLGLLERIIAPETPNAPPLLLTLAARALAGRYPNGWQPLPPRWRKALALTVEHVIDRQGAQTDADWGFPSAFKKERNPTATRYLPLLHVLDLPEPVLIDNSDRVIAACERAIAEVDVGLNGIERMLRIDTWSTTERLVRKYYRNVVEGMAVGAAVYERARDILSEAVLDELGATIPHLKGDESIETRAPSCLGFRDSLTKGVINPWETWRDDRPGAILVFGPPGTGKTSNARLIAAELNGNKQKNKRWWRFLPITPADFAREGRDKIVGSAEKLFKDLKDVRGCVVLMDEMEEFLRARGGPDADPDARLITTAFLPLLQDISDRRELVLIVATNFVGAIDPAVLRPGRFDMILPLGPMGKKDREDAIKKITQANYDSKKRSEALDHLINYTHGCTYTEIKDLIDRVSKKYADAEAMKNILEAEELDDESRSHLITALWNERVLNPPTALLGQAGASWDSFREEDDRFARRATGVEYSPDESYWQRPHFPDYKQRRGESI